MNKTKKSSYIQRFRIIIQIIFFFLLPGLYANALMGIRLLWQGLFDHSFSLSGSLPMMISAISIIPLTLLFGRFFCGWMCAFGTLGDALYYLSRKVFKIKFRINEKADHVLKYAKYAVFIFIFLAVWSIRAFNISALSPWDAFGGLLTFTRLPDFSYIITNVTIGFILLLIIMAGSLFVERFFCRYLCPLGAVFSIISHLRFIKIRKPSKDCGSCRACTRKCSMGIPLYQMDVVSSGECINCMKCIPVCPRENMHVTIAASVTNPALAGALAVTAMTGVYYVGTFATNGSLTSPDANQVIAAKNSSIYADGKYEGSGTGFRGATTTVSVTITGGAITNVKALSYGDDGQYFNSAFNPIVKQIISTQSAAVDAVSGATFSSNGILEAVSNALESARQAKDGSASDITSTGKAEEVTVTPTQAVTKAPTVTAKASKEESSSSTNGKSSSDSTKTSSTKSTTKTGSDTKSAASPTPTTVADSKKSSSSKYKDGTYKGSATGFQRGVTTVSVTVKDDTITHIQIESNGDVPRFFDSAYPTIIREILGSQSTNVDTVSGATYSSKGIMNAVADALSNAKN